MSTSESICILFAGGGTGGHLYPGLAIAEQLARVDAVGESKGDSNSAPSRCVFLCSDRAIDRSILESAGVCFEAIPAKPLIVRPRGLARFIGSWGLSVRAARAIIRRERATGARVVMAAMGGFVAAPCVQAAKAERLPVVMVNLDAVPGKANRWIARRADRVLTAAAVASRPWTRIPPIVRSAAIASTDAPACRMSLGLDPSTRTLLVTGGSQGATSINQFMVHFARAHASQLANWQILHQAGKGATADVEAGYRAAGVRAIVREFLNPIGPAWGAADLALGRCGAGTVAEAWANRVPSLLLPYPFHADDHQRANAQVLVDARAAIVRTDHVNTDQNVRDAGQALLNLIMDSTARDAMRQAAQALPPPDGAARVAQAILALVGMGRNVD